MKRDQVRVGGRYYAKVSGQVVPVEITEDLGCSPAWRGRELHRGWNGRSLASGRSVHIRSAQRLRGPVVDRPFRDDREGERRAEQRMEDCCGGFTD